MNIHFLRSVYTFLGLLAYSSSLYARSPMLYSGSIRFPSTVKIAPNVPIYWGGNRIQSETDGSGRAWYFSIPGERQQRFFYLVITDAQHLRPRKLDQNTVCYWYINETSPYKFYRLELVEDYDTTTGKPCFTWVAKELCLLHDDLDNLRIPEDAITICYPPHLVANLEGGTAIDLPTIVVAPDVLSLVGSEDKLHDKSIEMLLSTLDINALHTSIHQETKQDRDPKIIMAITT